jgi:Fur family transcriptional regulator, ferric uptake regulator
MDSGPLGLTTPFASIKMKMKFNFKMEGSMRSGFFRSMVGGGGLKVTRQREEILHVFLNSPGHKNLAQIYAQVVKANPKIGYTTVYRTLKLLTRLGLATERRFDDGETRYERVPEGKHHDHLFCLGCGKIIEFEDSALEALQNVIAERHHFHVFHHRMELYGECRECGEKKQTLSRHRSTKVTEKT